MTNNKHTRPNMTMKPNNAKEVKEVMDALRDAGTALDTAHTEAWVKVTNAWNVFAEQVMLAIEGMDDARTTYNGALETAHSVVEDAASELEERVGSRSEKWQESAAGLEANAQIEGMRALASEYTEVEPLSLTDLPDIGADGIPDLDPNDQLTLPEIVMAETHFDEAGGAL